MNFKLIVLSVIFMFINGCSYVSSVNQLGEEIYIANEKDWNGTWVTHSGSLNIHVVNAKLGEIEVLFIEHGKLEKHKIYLTKTAKDSYLNLINKAEDKFFFLGKFIKNKNELILWAASTEYIKKAIVNKSLAGKTTNEKHDGVSITASKEALNKYFKDNRDKMLFFYEEPLVLRRLRN